MQPPVFHLAYFCREGQYFHFSRIWFHGPSHCQLHTHDFYELFWLEEGAVQHSINGTTQQLTAGSLVALRLTDCHGFHNPPGSAGFGMVNIAFSADTLVFLRERYFPDAKTFFWADTPLPFTMQLSPARQAWLHGWADYLSRRPCTRLALERFLLDLLGELHVQAPAALDSPAWLEKALVDVRNPKHFIGGTRQFARLAGRSARHVNRALKQFHGLTATDAVNQARMHHAATELMMTTKKVIDIGLECGFENPGHFYKVFRQFYGTTPRLYRMNQRAVVLSEAANR